jgi:hypothetical protein
MDSGHTRGEYQKAQVNIDVDLRSRGAPPGTRTPNPLVKKSRLWVCRAVPNDAAECRFRSSCPRRTVTSCRLVSGCIRPLGLAQTMKCSELEPLGQEADHA